MSDDKNKLKKENEELPKEGAEAEKPEVRGSGIFTVDGEELPEIDGGWDIIGADSGLGDNDFEG